MTPALQRPRRFLAAARCAVREYRPRQRAEARELLAPRLRALVAELEDVVERHGRRLSLLGFVGSVEMNFSPHGFANSRLTVFFRPKRTAPGTESDAASKHSSGHRD